MKKVPQERADERLWELAYLRAINHITPERFVQLVNIIDMRPTVYAPYPFDGCIRGSFRIIERLLTDEVISDEEYNAIARGTAMKIWVDDIRTPPDDSWLWCRTSKHAISVLDSVSKWHTNPVEIMSLDHDLGTIAYTNQDDTTRPIVLWCCENDFWPVEVRVHSANPVGIEWLEGMIERYKT